MYKLLIKCSQSVQGNICFQSGPLHLLPPPFSLTNELEQNRYAIRYPRPHYQYCTARKRCSQALLRIAYHVHDVHRRGNSTERRSGD